MNLRILSLGAGVQSTVLALMVENGDIPMVDGAIFADTKWEPRSVYHHLNWLEKQLSYPVYRVSAGDLRADQMRGENSTGQKFYTMPLYTAKGGMGRRQCTNEHKLSPIKKQIRKMLGVEYGKHVPKTAKVTQLIGISTDEAVRMKPSRDVWLTNEYPLIDMEFSRQKCLAWFATNHPGRKLEKSACIGCPYHDNGTWRDMKKNDPVSWADAVEFDKSIRKDTHEPGQFLHQKLQPLEEIDFRTLEDLGQTNMFNDECEGMCGV